MGKRVERVPTDQFCKEVAPPSHGQKLYRCGTVRGLALRVTSAGHRSFVFCYSGPAGREHRMTVGEYGSWSLSAAKKRVAELRRELDQGVDPLQRRQERRKAPTLGRLWTWYQAHELPKLSEASQRNISRDWDSKLRPLLGSHTKLADLTRPDIQRMFDVVTQRSGETAANRCHSYIRRMLNLAVVQELVEKNVAKSLQRSGTAAPPVPR